MRAFNAMLLDAYRELNSRKLFWVTLTISAGVALFYASIGFNRDGMFLFFGLKQIESDVIYKGSQLAVLLYRSIFSSFIVGIWLAWVMIVLAVISTASIFPGFVASGTIDLVLAKPISRIRLFLYKYLFSLLFVFLQVALFCTAIFLCMGWRLGDWDWKIFVAVPLLTLFFSYLYCVTTLIGIWTRSSLAALLITLLFWFSLFSINQTDNIVTTIREDTAVQLERASQGLEQMQAAQEDGPDDAAASRMLEKQEELLESLDKWQRVVRTTRSFIPKTEETVALVERSLIRETDVNIMDILSGNVRQLPSGEFVSTDESRNREVQERLIEEIRSRSLWYIIGTSLAFEAVVLALAAFLFVRRDY